MVSRLVSRAISLDDRITGAVLPGYKKHVEPLAGLITAYKIPAISYIYADDDLMDQVELEKHILVKYLTAHAG